MGRVSWDRLCAGVQASTLEYLTKLRVHEKLTQATPNREHDPVDLVELLVHLNVHKKVCDFWWLGRQFVTEVGCRFDEHLTAEFKSNDAAIEAAKTSQLSRFHILSSHPVELSHAVKGDRKMLLQKCLRAIRNTMTLDDQFRFSSLVLIRAKSFFSVTR